MFPKRNLDRNEVSYENLVSRKGSWLFCFFFFFLVWYGTVYFLISTSCNWDRDDRLKDRKQAGFLTPQAHRRVFIFLVSIVLGYLYHVSTSLCTQHTGRHAIMFLTKVANHRTTVMSATNLALYPDFFLKEVVWEMEKEMATHSSVLAWRSPGTGEPGGLPSMGSHRVRHHWRDLAAAAAALWEIGVNWANLLFPRSFLEKSVREAQRGTGDLVRK